MPPKFTIQILDKLLAEGKIRSYSVTNISKKCDSKKSKYGNKKVEFDGTWFDSKKELKRWLELKMLEKVGEITGLERQIPYELNEGGTHSLKYVADFQYKTKEGELITEDCKGYKTKTYKKKRALMLKIYGIKILET